MAIQVNSNTVIDDNKNLSANATTLTTAATGANFVGNGSGLTGISGGGIAITSPTVQSLDAATYLDPVVDTNWTWITSNITHAAALKSDGSLWTWGANSYGELGLGDVVNRNRPTKVGTSSWTQVAASHMATFALKGDGTLWGFGRSAKGDNTGTNYSSPIQIGSATNWSYVYNDRHGAIGAINTSGQVWLMGHNQYGKLGVGITGSTFWVSSLTQLSGTWKQGYRTLNWCRYSGGYIDSSGNAWMAGYNAQGQLGLSPGNGYTANAIGGPGGFGHVAPSTQFGMYFYRTTDSSVWTIGGPDVQWWGRSGNYSSPVQISTSSLPTNIKWVLGGSNMALIRTDGTMWACDNGNYMELGPGANTSLYNNGNFNKSSWIQLGTRIWGSVTQPLTHPMIADGYGLNIFGNNSRFTAYYAIDSIGTLRFNGVAGGNYPYYYNGNATDWDQSGLGALTTDMNNSIWSYYKMETIIYNNFAKVQSGTTNFNCASYNTFILNHDDDIWNMTFSGVPTVCEIIINRKRLSYRLSDKTWAPQYNYANQSDALVIRWPKNIQWDKGQMPNRALLPNGIDEEIITLSTTNGGTTWYGRIDFDGVTGHGGGAGNGNLPRDVQGGTNLLTAEGDQLGYMWASGSGGWAGSGSPVQPPAWGFPDLPALKSSPVLLSNDLWKQVLTNGNWIVGIKADGTMWGSGVNSSGALGLGNTTTLSAFTQIWSFRKDWAYIANTATNDGIVGVTTSNQIWVCGYQYRGTFGLGNSINVSTPVQVPIPTGLQGRIKQIAVNQWQMWVLASDGTVWRTGAAQDDSIGVSSGGVVDLSTLTQLGTDTDWAGFNTISDLRHNYLRKYNNSWYALGSTNGGPQGFADGSSYSTPVQLGSRINSSQTGLLFNPRWHFDAYSSAAIITASGDLWGTGQMGFFNSSSSLNISSFVLLESGTAYQKIFPGNQANFFGIKTDGTLWGWGNNTSYWLQSINASSIAIYSSPVQIGTGGGWISVSSFAYGWVGLRNTPF